MGWVFQRCCFPYALERGSVNGHEYAKVPRGPGWITGSREASPNCIVRKKIMSWQATSEPQCTRQTGPVKLIIEPRSRDLGGFHVRRALPAPEQRMVGPFIFLDQIGPAELPPSIGIDVRPHPHIGLSTLTWLIEGEILHRDSIGSIQHIRPGAVNWMTAGSGIAHSERTPSDVRARGSRLFGLQTWLALPLAHEETEPSFQHVAAAELPVIDGPGLRIVLIAGSGWDRRSPVTVFSETICADATPDDSAVLTISTEHTDRAVYVLQGEIDIAGHRYAAGSLLVLVQGVEVSVRARTSAKLVVIGGEPVEGPRHIWWNFVSSRAERITQAKADWKNGKFARVIDDDEFIPLPDG
jgi:redox-sensitive bicupin YhaK (pirin superfamily)